MLQFDLPQPTVEIAGSDRRFPVRRIYCIGRNYAKHIAEMGNDPERTPPVFFCKPADAIVPSGAKIPYPMHTSDLHHEIELVVAVGKAGRNIPADQALSHVFGYAVGIDLTRRDLQKIAKDRGQPWDSAKAFDNSAPLSPLHPASILGHPQSGRIWLAVNDEIRQDADLDALIWSVPECLAELSTYFALAPGDLVFTGTPEGVGPVAAGDRLRGGIEKIDEIDIRIG